MSAGWEWPAPEGPECGAEAHDLATGEYIACRLRARHGCQEHHWERVCGDTLLAATWIATGPITFIGEPA